MALRDMFTKGDEAGGAADRALRALLSGYSIEVTPRTAARIADFRALLPAGTRVYIAHIEGTPVDDMVATARRLTGEGLAVMPHLPARGIRDVAMLDEMLSRYREAGVDQALVLAGGAARPAGQFESSVAMLQTGLFEAHGFTRLHVAGHPEGNADIDPDGASRNADAALVWKQDFARLTGIEMAIVTQFAFEAAPILAWTRRLADAGIALPVHLGVAGPAKLQTLLKYAVACGIGPSLRVLRRRALDLTRLMLPYEPTQMLREIAEHRAANPQSPIAQVHLFPLGGIGASVEWAGARLQPLGEAA